MKSLLQYIRLAAAAAIVSLPAIAAPTATLRITDLTSNTVLLNVLDFDGILGSADDQDDTLGAISLDSPITLTGGDWRLRFTGASTKPDSGTASLPQMFMQATIELLTATPRSLRIEFSETGFDANPFQAKLGTTTGTSNGAAGSVHYGASIDSVTNALFAGGNNYLPLDTTNVTNDNVYSSSRLGASVVPLNPLYSLTLTSEVVFTNAGRIDVDAALAVPEPGFYGALALGLSGLFTVVIRRRRASAQSAE